MPQGSAAPTDFAYKNSNIFARAQPGIGDIQPAWSAIAVGMAPEPMMEFVVMMAFGVAIAPVTLFVSEEKAAPAVQIALVYKVLFLEFPMYQWSSLSAQKNLALFCQL